MSGTAATAAPSADDLLTQMQQLHAGAGQTGNAGAPSADDLLQSLQGLHGTAPTREQSTVAPPPPLGIGGQIVGGVGAINRGVSFGGNDPFQAAADYLLPSWWSGKDSALRQKMQGTEQQFQTEHPLLQATGEAVGSVPTYAMGEGALTRVIPGAIGAGAGLLSKFGNVLGASTRNAVVSGVAGGGFTEGDATAKAEGAGEGAAVGAVVPGVFAGLGKVLRGVVSPIVARLFTGAAESQATSKIAEAAARDGMTVGELATNLKALGPQATLADVGGQNVRNLAAAVANKPGEAAQLAQQVLGDRAAQAPQVVNDAITAATGSTGDYHAALAKLGAQRSADAGPLYTQAFSQPLPAAEGAAAQRFMQSPVGDKALQNAMRVIQTEKMTANEAFNPADYGVTAGDNGKFQVDPSAPPNLRLLDAVKGGYDDIVEGYRNDTTGKLNLDREGYAANNARAQLVSELRDASPTYAKALDAWGGPSRAMDAISMGRRALSNDPEVNAATIAKLSDTDKEFFKTGVARALKDKVDSAQEGADVTRRIFGNTLVRNKIQAAFGDPGAFDAFQQTMEQQAAFARTKNAVTVGSRTTPLLRAQEDAGADYITPAAMLLHGNVPGAALHIAGQGYNALADSSGPRMAAIGRQMFAQPPTNEYLNALDQRLVARTNPLAARNAARALAVMEANRLTAPRKPQ